jgi:ribosome-binding factor A
VTRRAERVAEEIREEVARIVGGDLKDPRIGFVTVTRVSLSADLRTAHVLIGVLGAEAEREKTLAGLGKAAGFVRREVGRRIRMRHTPEIRFHYDPGLDATDRVARLLEEEEQRAAARPEDEVPPDGGED